MPGGFCSRCVFCGPAGECRDGTAFKSGRCGDWVWYVRNGHQWRRRWVKGFDPKTAKQRAWWARLAAASKAYSEALNKEQWRACIAGRRQAADPATAGPGRAADWAAVLGGQGKLGDAAHARPAGPEAEILSRVGTSVLGEPCDEVDLTPDYENVLTD